MLNSSFVHFNTDIFTLEICFIVHLLKYGRTRYIPIYIESKDTVSSKNNNKIINV
jgi:hypothetical protein